MLLAFFLAVVGRITVRTERVFSATEANRGGFYRATNLLATPTREELIRKFLLFREGEPFDEAKLRESERNLRALDFLMSAKVTAADARDGVIDVLVETQDAWSTDVNADFSNDGGRSLYDVDVTQKNLFGTGAAIDVRAASGLERRTRSIELLHPALFGAYWNTDLLYAKSSDGNEEKLAVERPLFSHDTAHTLSVSFDHLLRDSRRYEAGQLSALFREEHREAAVLAGRTILTTGSGATRLLAGGDWLEDSFQPVRGVEPAGRNFRFAELGVDTTAFEFIKANHVDLGVREQDFNLGACASLIGGWSPPGHGHGVVWRIRSDASRGVRTGSRSFVITHVSGTMRAGDTNRNAIVSGDSRFVARFETAWPQAFVARAHIDHGSDLDRDVQYFADGQNGLRAYPNYAFSGDRRFVFNAEQRVFLGREWLQLLEPGAALFIDSGRAGTGPLRTDVGAGIRLGISRLDAAVLRFDAAYALNDSPLSRRGLVFSFATSQAF
jgi:hemolysin activation/secretion protein